MPYDFCRMKFDGTHSDSYDVISPLFGKKTIFLLVFL